MRASQARRRPPALEDRDKLARHARERLESLQDRYFSDDEWAVVRKRLRDFFLVLQDWSKR